MIYLRFVREHKNINSPNIPRYKKLFLRLNRYAYAKLSSKYSVFPIVDIIKFISCLEKIFIKTVDNASKKPTTKKTCALFLKLLDKIFCFNQSKPTPASMHAEKVKINKNLTGYLIALSICTSL